MKCAKCSGLMVVDHLLDMQESYVPMWMQALRCLSCGNIVDPLIHHHRLIQCARRSPQRVSPSTQPMASPARAA